LSPQDRILSLFEGNSAPGRFPSATGVFPV
jgi:hypothetical protein